MIVTSSRATLSGTVNAPASKSHTIRALLIAALAGGRSVIELPLDSQDTRSAAAAVSSFGAGVIRENGRWLVDGVGGRPLVPDDIIDVGNSGTTLYMVMGTASLADGWTVLTGDHQIRRRPATALVEALLPLGVEVFSTRGNGCAPLAVRGVMNGGSTSVEAVSSQYLSSLLLSCPLAGGDTVIDVPLLNEAPYVRMTLDWLDLQGVRYSTDDDMRRFDVPGGQSYRPFERRVPGDFSSATFMLCAGALCGGDVTVAGLGMDDSQGDKAVVDILRRMGATILVDENGVTVGGGGLRGVEVDMNPIPDALPMLAVCGCFAEGETVLGNVGQARLKETDRIAVMASELTKLGADVRELPDGLVIRGTGLSGGRVHGHGDHRVVMAMTVAGCAADGPVTVDTAEAADVTYPGFWEALGVLGAHIDGPRDGMDT